MRLELIDAVTVDAFERGKQERDIHIYYKFIDKGYMVSPMIETWGYFIAG